MLVNPLTYSTALLRQVLTPGLPDGSPEASTSLVVTVAFGIVLLAASAALASQKSSRSAA
jgi:ABC-type polysaccharide/polyol phosphate export permease